MRPSIIGILAFALVAVGVILAGGVLVRLCEDFGCPGPIVELPTPTPVPVFVGSMALVTPTPTDISVSINVRVPDAECPPTPAGGLPVDTAVQAIGTLRLYPTQDTLSVVVAEHNTGDQFRIVADAGGATAIKRCEVLWVRVRNAAAVEGWVLDAAVERALPPVTPLPISPCPSPGCVSCGCGQQQSGCVQPCGYGQRCYPPCGNPCPNQPNYPCYNPCQSPCAYQGYDPG